MSSIVDVAVALTTALAGHTFSKAMAVERTYSPEHGLESMVTPRLLVVVRSDDTSPVSRSADQAEYQIDVAVQAKLEKASGEELTEEIDGWMAVVDEVKRYLNRLRPATLQATTVVSVKNKPVYSPAHMRKLSVFTSVVTPTVRVTRAV